jgi:hypothetical protein
MNMKVTALASLIVSCVASFNNARSQIPGMQPPLPPLFNQSPIRYYLLLDNQLAEVTDVSTGGNLIPLQKPYKEVIMHDGKKLPVTGKIDRVCKDNRFVTRLELQRNYVRPLEFTEQFAIEILSVLENKRKTIFTSKSIRPGKIEDALNSFPPQTISSNDQQITTTLVHNGNITTRPLRIAGPPEAPKPIPTPKPRS